MSKIAKFLKPIAVAILATIAVSMASVVVVGCDDSSIVWEFDSTASQSK